MDDKQKQSKDKQSKETDGNIKNQSSNSDDVKIKQAARKKALQQALRSNLRRRKTKDEL